MKFFSIKTRVIFALILLVPTSVFAQTNNSTCSSKGYTIETVNGVFTDEVGAVNNKKALGYLLQSSYRDEPIIIDYLLNPTHIGGLGDVATAIKQKAFEGEAVGGYDLTEMIRSASEKVKTQKLLLVAHSQGNFYANSFYDVVTKEGWDVNKESIGIYSVANPASRVAGKGQWITSDTDKVIAWVVASVPFKNIMAPNTHIALQKGDDFAGHGFSEAYLKYKSTEIVNGIKSSLDKLVLDPKRSEYVQCIATPKLTLAHKTSAAVLAVADPVVEVSIATVVVAGKIAVFPTVILARGLYFVVSATVNTGIFVAKAILDTGVYVAGKAIDITTVAVGEVSNIVTGLLSGGPIPADSNTASIVGAFQNSPQTAQHQQVTPSIPPQNNNLTPTLVVVPPQAINHSPTQVPQLLTEDTPSSLPKLVFVGYSPGYGGGATPQTQQVLGSSVETESVTQEEVDITTTEELIVTQQLSAPDLSAPQCAYSLATDGCLLATTTVRFLWTAIPGAEHYKINKNGTTATTTDTFTDIIVRDFSSYTFIISAIDENGLASATSTQKVFVATIPIAINEIAWMGTAASANDEWFEIKNNTPYTIDLTQWELNAKDGTPHVQLAGTIAPRAYLIFERSDDTAVSDVEAHQSYTGALGNAGEQINLSYASTTLDQTPEMANSAWAGGDNGSSTTTKKTMERYSSREDGSDPMNWGTNLGYIKNGTDANGDEVNGTPGEQNSVSTLINRGEDITSDFTLTADEERYVLARGTNVSASSTLTIEPGVNIVFNRESDGEEGCFYVNGVISALGTEENPIKINGNSVEDPEGSIYFENTLATSTFEYTHFENVRGLDVEQGAVRIESSKFVSTGGVWGYGGRTTLLIDNTMFASSTNTSIYINDGASVTLASSTISNQLDENAIEVYEGNLKMASTTLENSQDGSGIFAYNSSITIASSTFSNINEDAISLHDCTTVIADTLVEGESVFSNGVIIDGGEATISNTSISSFSEGVGIVIDEPTKSVIVKGGEITGNSIGVAVNHTESVVLEGVNLHDNGSGPEDDVVVW